MRKNTYSALLISRKRGHKAPGGMKPGFPRTTLLLLGFAVIVTQGVSNVYCNNGKCASWSSSAGVTPAEGYWMSSKDANVTAYQCPYPENCVPASNTSLCAEGATGPVCAICAREQGWAMVGRKCRKCSGNNNWSGPAYAFLAGLCVLCCSCCWRKRFRFVNSA